MENRNEQSLSIQIVHGGFILSAPTDFGGLGTGYKTEIFTSQAKLMRAVKAVIEEYSLVPSRKDKSEDEKVEAAE